jgi:hypothetical protein
MTRAANVLLDAVRSAPSSEELDAAYTYVNKSWDSDDVIAVARFISNRCRSVLQPERTPEERVTIQQLNGIDGYVTVKLDGEFKIKLPIEHAEIYRDGLIAELKREQEDSK